jgi:hypothetical protein
MSGIKKVYDVVSRGALESMRESHLILPACSTGLAIRDDYEVINRSSFSSCSCGMGTPEMK